MSPPLRSPLALAWCINGLFAGALIVTCVLSQADQPGPPCLFQWAFHLPCPGCGLTRSFKAMWRGEWMQALRYHPLGPMYFGLCAAFLLAALFEKFLIRTPLAPAHLHAWLIRKSTLLTLAALMLGVWFVKLCLLLAYSRGLHRDVTYFLL